MPSSAQLSTPSSIPSIPSIPATPERNRYHSYVSTGLSDLTCCICLETVSFPVSFPCHIHYACHKCMHQLVDCKKQITGSSSTPDIRPIALYPVQCPKCGDDSKTHTDCTLREGLSSQIGPLLSIVQLLERLQSNLPISERQRVPLIDDLSCPYCRKAFHPNGSFNERYDHLSVCPARKYKCARCHELVSASDLNNHLQERCHTFTCGECKQHNLTWGALGDHRDRTHVSTALSRVMATAFVNSGTYPLLSHHDEWGVMPECIKQACDLAVKHRRVLSRVDAMMMEFHKVKRALEQLDKQWSTEDAMHAARGLRAPPGSRSSSPVFMD